MITQDFELSEYDWRVRAYYYVDTYYTQEIIDELKLIGCGQENLEDARENLTENELNSGLCYSNPIKRKSVIVIAEASSEEQFVNSCFHESKHLLSHIEQTFGIDPYSEEAAYLSGHIGQKMFGTAKLFICDCHKNKLKQLKGT